MEKCTEGEGEWVGVAWPPKCSSNEHLDGDGTSKKLLKKEGVKVGDCESLSSIDGVLRSLEIY